MRVLQVFVACVLLGGVVGCKPATPVFLLTVDTLRPDHLPVYGYDRDTAPAISRLAEDGMVFTRAFTTSPKTSPAYASMFTGLYPHEHGLMRLGQALPGQNETLAELLDAAGYLSGGFVSSTVMIDRLSDLGQGFTIWDDRMPVKELHRDNFERHAPQTIDSALTWLDSLAMRREPFFLFVHLIDPHGPYTPPANYRARFRRGGGPKLAVDVIPAFQRLSGATTLGDYIDAYDGEIAHADEALGLLFDRLRDDGLYDEALIIVTSDHGESFGSDGVYFRHGVTLAEASTRIPLIIKPPHARSLGPQFSDSTVSLVDIVPTVLDYLGLAPRDDLAGQSLRPLVEGRGSDNERVVFSSRKVHGVWRVAAHGRERTLRDVTPSVDGSAARGPGRGPKTLEPGDRELLSEALAEHLRDRAAPRRNFDSEWRYRATDKTFVRRFVEVHNSALGIDDARNLRSLGYLE
jgi:arylsulfatase A-like enzyme